MDGHADDPRDGAEVDRDQLQQQLTQIKGAMGLDDRYPGQRKMWLVYGVVIGVAAIVTNLLFAANLSNTAYIVLWFAMAGVIVLAQWQLVSRTATEPTRSGPDWRVLFLAGAAGLAALWSSLGELIQANTAGALRGAHYFSHLVLFLGVGLLVAGAVLKAQRIRRRDRMPFYVGGGWMLALAALLPHIPVLTRFGYMIFGTLFMLHSLGAYLLTGSD